MLMRIGFQIRIKAECNMTWTLFVPKKGFSWFRIRIKAECKMTRLDFSPKKEGFLADELVLD